MITANLCLLVLVSVSILITAIYHNWMEFVFWKIFKIYNKYCIDDIQINIRKLYRPGWSSC